MISTFYSITRLRETHECVVDVAKVVAGLAVGVLLAGLLRHLHKLFQVLDTLLHATLSETRSQIL